MSIFYDRSNKNIKILAKKYNSILACNILQLIYANNFRIFITNILHSDQKKDSYFYVTRNIVRTWQQTLFYFYI